MRRAVAVLILGAYAAACGSSSSDSSSAPTLAKVAGTWTGTIQFTHVSNGSPVQAVQNVSFVLTENGSTVTGTWATSTGTVAKQGNVNGTVTASSFSGTFSFVGTTIATGATCSGNLTVSGAAGGNALTWTSPGVVGNCTDPPTNVTFAVSLTGP